MGDRSVRHLELFGGGDCISLEGTPLARVGVYAVRQNRILHRNLLAFLEGRPLRRFDPGGAYLTILNMGDGRGIFVRKGFVREGGSGMGRFDYFKPVSTWTADDVLVFLREKGVGECNLVDVRQPGEYEGGHLPGARLFPIAELGSRLHELDREKPTITY